MADSPGSSDLSSPPSEEYEDQLSAAGQSSRPSVDHSHADTDHLAPPPKRRKTAANPSHRASYDRAPSSQPDPDAEDTLSISEDGFSDAPSSPTHDEWAMREEAQIECLWRDCEFGRALNNDDLVLHVQTTHCATGGPKKTKYVCEWGECQKKASNHPSGYALKAHMRSHTKEKPYYCALPECDKAFTRSDALAKHMRTVHEPEPARGSGPNAAALDPHATGKKSIKLKLSNGTAPKGPPIPPNQTNNLGPSHDEDGNPVDPSPPNNNITYLPAHHPYTGQPGFMIHYPPDIHFNGHESYIQADELMRTIRRQIKWAEDEGKTLERDNAALERIRREEWTLKEILLHGVVEAELARADKDSLPDWSSAEEILRAMERDLHPLGLTVWKGKKPVWHHRRRRVRDDVKEEPVAAVESPVDPADSDADDSVPGSPASGGFDGEDDPYDNYVRELYKKYMQKANGRSGEGVDALPAEPNPDESEDARADAATGLMDLSGGSR